MRTLITNKEGTIIEGVLQGTNGLVIAFDSSEDEVHLQVDKHSVIVTYSENIYQEKN